MNEARFPARDPAGAPRPSRWRSAGVLSQMGLQPLLVERVLQRVSSTCGDVPPPSLAEEIEEVSSALATFWRSAPPTQSGSPPIHLFIGPPGSGKTTVLCKWMAKSVLAEGQTVRCWRLDSRAANFPGLLDVYGEILHVPVAREWTGSQGLAGCDAGFVDLPGINSQDDAAFEQLRAQLHRIAGAEVHLVLNAAYDPWVLSAQARAFDSWPVSDVIFTHLDEEKRVGKLWNFVLGTKFTVRFLSSGQNIPGEFSAASPQLLNSQ